MKNLRNSLLRRDTGELELDLSRIMPEDYVDFR